MPSTTASPSKPSQTNHTVAPEPSLPEWDAAHGCVVAARPPSRVTKSLSPQRGRSTATGAGRSATRERPASVAHGESSDSSGLPSLERQSRPVTRDSNASVSRPATRNGDQPREHNHLFSDGHLKLRAREKIYNVNLVSRGMPSYEPLLDGYLQDHFATPSIRAHLKRLGIIDADGYIIDEREFQHMQLAMDRAEKAIQLERESQQRDLDREVEVVVRHAQDPLETQAPPRDHANEEWSAVVEKYTRSLLPPVAGQNRRISSLNDGKQLRPRTQESHQEHKRQEEQAASKPATKQRSPSPVSAPAPVATSPDYEDDFVNDSSPNLTKDDPPPPAKETHKDAPSPSPVVRPDPHSSEPVTESMTVPTTTRIAEEPAKPPAPKPAKSAKQVRTATKSKASEQPPTKPKQPTEGDVKLYQTRFDAIALHDLAADNASQTHSMTKELCEQISASFTAPVIDASLSLRKILAEAALLRARAAYLLGNVDDCNSATEIVFRNSPGIPGVQMDLVLFKYNMLTQKEQKTSSSTTTDQLRKGDAVSTKGNTAIEDGESASPPVISAGSGKELTETERVLVDQISALGGDVNFAIEKLRSTGNLAQGTSQAPAVSASSQQAVEVESPSTAVLFPVTDPRPAPVGHSSSPNLAKSSQAELTKTSQGNLAKGSQLNVAKSSKGNLASSSQMSVTTRSRGNLAQASSRPTSSRARPVTTIPPDVKPLDSAKPAAMPTSATGEPTPHSKEKPEPRPTGSAGISEAIQSDNDQCSESAPGAVAPLVTAEPVATSLPPAGTDYADDFETNHGQQDSITDSSTIPLPKSVVGSMNALDRVQSKSNAQLVSQSTASTNALSGKTNETEIGGKAGVVAPDGIEQDNSINNPFASSHPASTAASRQLLADTDRHPQDRSESESVFDPASIPLPASVAASQALFPSNSSGQPTGTEVQPQDIPLPLSVAGSTLLLNSHQSPQQSRRSTSRQNLSKADKGSKSYLASGPKAAKGSRQSLQQLDPSNIPLPASAAASTMLLNESGKSGSQVARPSSSGGAPSSKRTKSNNKLYGSTSSIRGNHAKSLGTLSKGATSSSAQHLRTGTQSAKSGSKIMFAGDRDEISQNEAAAMPLPASRAESKIWLS